MNRVYSQSGCCPRTDTLRDPRWTFFACRIQENDESGARGPKAFAVRLVNAVTGAGLPNAVFRLTGSGGTPLTAITNARGMAEFSPLRPGSYQLAEEKAPDGYAATDTRYAVQMDALGKVWVNGVLAQDFTIRNAPLPVKAAASGARAKGQSAAPAPPVQAAAHTMQSADGAGPAAAAAPAHKGAAPKTVDAPKAMDAPKAAGAPKVVGAPKAMEAPKAMDAPKVADAPKVVEAPKATDAPNAPGTGTSIAAAPPAPKEPEKAATEAAPPEKGCTGTTAAATNAAVVTGEWVSYGNRIVLVRNNSHTGDFDSPVVEVGIKYAFGDPDMERPAMMNGTVGNPFDVHIPVAGNGVWHYAAFVKTENGDTYYGTTESARYP